MNKPLYMKVAKKHLKNCGVDQIGITTKKNYLCKALRSAVLFAPISSDLRWKKICMETNQGFILLVFLTKYVYMYSVHVVFMFVLLQKMRS